MVTTKVVARDSIRARGDQSRLNAKMDSPFVLSSNFWGSFDWNPVTGWFIVTAARNVPKETASIFSWIGSPEMAKKLLLTCLLRLFFVNSWIKISLFWTGSHSGWSRISRYRGSTWLEHCFLFPTRISYFTSLGNKSIWISIWKEVGWSNRWIPKSQTSTSSSPIIDVLPLNVR